jgi:hypothetical protein
MTETPKQPILVDLISGLAIPHDAGGGPVTENDSLRLVEADPKELQPTMFYMETESDRRITASTTVAGWFAIQNPGVTVVMLTLVDPSAERCETGTL